MFSWQKGGQLWLLKPRSQSRTDVGGHPVHTNAYGLRDREIEAKPEGSLRILVLGDSVTFGYGLALEDTFVRGLEARFAAERLHVQVVNAGMYGWSTRQQYLFYEAHGEELDPDLILVGLVLNDIKDAKNALDLELGETSMRAINLLTWLAERTATFAALKQAYVGAFAPQVREIKEVADLIQKRDAPEVRRAMELTESELERILDLCRRRGHGFGLVIIPFKFQLESDGLDHPQRRLLAFAATHRIPALDLLPALGRHPAEDVMMDHVHLTARGHELAAAAIADWVLRERLLAPARTGGSPQ
jgi:lysophospholipase L1-like esterase